MKTKNLFLVLLLSVFLTSCTVMQTPSNGQVSVNWDTSYYDYDQIHYLYTNYPSYFWNYQYVNNFGVRTYFYNHPYFIRYRRDCVRRNVRYTPYRQYNNTRRVTYNNNNRQREVFQNRGRSNQQYRNNNTYRKPQRTVQRSPQRVTRTPNVTRRTPSYRSVPQRTTPQRSNYRSSTQRSNNSIKRSTINRTRSSSPSRGRKNNQ